LTNGAEDAASCRRVRGKTAGADPRLRRRFGIPFDRQNGTRIVRSDHLPPSGGIALSSAQSSRAGNRGALDVAISVLTARPRGMGVRGISAASFRLGYAPLRATEDRQPRLANFRRLNDEMLRR